jgi:hypothetical protein
VLSTCHLLIADGQIGLLWRGRLPLERPRSRGAEYAIRQLAKYGGVASLWSSYARDESTRHRLRAQRMGTYGGWLLRVCQRCVAHFTL